MQSWRGVGYRGPGGPRELILVLALGIFVAGNAIGALAADVNTVLLRRVLAGFGAALFSPNPGENDAVEQPLERSFAPAGNKCKVIVVSSQFSARRMRQSRRD